MKKVLRISQIIILTGIISFLFSLNSYSQSYQDSCLDLIWSHQPERGLFNPDSVKYDTCFCSNPFKYFPEVDYCYLEHLYANKWYTLIFKNKDPFNFPPAPADSVIETDWRDLDTSLIDLRNLFEKFENRFGNFILRKVHPDFTDSNDIFSRGYNVKLNYYMCIDSIINYFGTSNYLEGTFYTRNFHFNPDELVVEENEYNNSLKVIPNPASEYIEINVVENGRQQTADGRQERDIQIFTVLGECIIKSFLPSDIGEGQGVRFDISHFPNGIYFIRIGNEIHKFEVLR